MTQAQGAHGHGSDNLQPKITPEKLAHYDQAFEKLYGDKRFGIPRLNLDEVEESAVRQYGRLRERERTHDRLGRRRDELNERARRAMTTEERASVERQQAEVERELAANPALTPVEQAEQVAFGARFGGRVEAYVAESQAELGRAPKREAFSGFRSVIDELDESDGEDNPDRVQTRREREAAHSAILLEEVQVLIGRLFNRHHALRAFFEEYVILKYDPDRPVRRAEAAHDPHASEQGGADVRRQTVDGHEKYVVTVDRATFIQEKSFKNLQGNDVTYNTVDMVASAFTIAKAILRVALNDEVLKSMTAVHPFTGVPKPERYVEQPHNERVDQTVHGHGEHLSPEEAIEFIALYLVDPEQATKVDAKTGRGWVGRTKGLLTEISPETGYEMKPGEHCAIDQAVLNYDELYHDYDKKRREKFKTRLGKVGEWLANDELGTATRVIGGAAVGGSIGGAFGTLWGALGGGVGGGLLGGILKSPLQLVRTIQATAYEKFDFYYELAEAEHDKKEVARIKDREENIGDRDLRLRAYFETGNKTDARRLILADSETGDFNIWRVYLFLYAFDPHFRKSGGTEIEQENFNFVTRLHRLSNKAKRVGTKGRFFEHLVDDYGRHKYVLRSWDAYYNNVRNEWEAVSERGAQDAALETYEMMVDGYGGFMDLKDEYGDDLSDPNSRGWYVPQTGDLRTLIGPELAGDFLGWMQSEFKGDRRYLRKFNANEITAIQRMRKFDPTKFPGEHTKQTAREAFDHYSRRIPFEEEPLDEKDRDLEEQITKQPVQQLLDDVDERPDELRDKFEETITDSYERPFGGNPEGKSMKHQSLRGYYNERLGKLQEELDQFLIDEVIGETLRRAMWKLAEAYRDELQDVEATDSRAEREATIRILQEDVETILEKPDRKEEDRFKARLWLEKLTDVVPRVQAITNFRTDLMTQIQVYRNQAKQSPESRSMAGVLGDLDRLSAEIHNGLPVDEARTRLETLLDELATVAPSLKVEDDLRQAIRQIGGALANPESLQHVLGQVKQQMQTKAKKANTDYQTKDSGKSWLANLKQQRDEIEQLTQDVEQAVRLNREEPPIEGVHEQRLEEQVRRLVRFRDLTVIPEELKQETLTNEQMLGRLKLAYLATWYEANKLEKAGKKDAKKDEKPKVVDTSD